MGWPRTGAMRRRADEVTPELKIAVNHFLGTAREFVASARTCHAIERHPGTFENCQHPDCQLANTLLAPVAREAPVNFRR